MKIDFVLIAKIDSQERLHLLKQSLETFASTVSNDLYNRFVFINDKSSIEVNSEVINLLASKFEDVFAIENDVQLGVGGSKNFGVDLHTKCGRGDLLYMFDADVFFTDGWLETLVDAYEKHGDTFKIIAGGVHPFLQPREGEQVENITSHDAISGWSWLLDYNTWSMYGTLADNSLGTGKSEDWEYCQRIRNDGYLVGCVQPQVIAHCGITNTEGDPIVGQDVSIQLAHTIVPEAILL